MRSIQSYLVNGLIRFKIKRHASKRQPFNLKRRSFDRLGSKLAITEGIEISSVDLGGAEAERLQPVGQTARCTVLYFHGGAYVSGSSASHRPLTAALCKATQAEIFVLNYRLAPEHPYPAALDDALAAYRAILESGIRPDKLTIAGDSAGGGLVLALLLSIKQHQLSMPACSIVYSPWTDLSLSLPSITENRQSCAMLAEGSLEESAKHYSAGEPVTQPLVSPISGDFSGCPPIQIFVSTSELLRDDALSLYESLVKYGVNTRLIKKDGLVHVWPLFHRYLPEGRQAIEQTAEFIHQHS